MLTHKWIFKFIKIMVYIGRWSIKCLILKKINMSQNMTKNYINWSCTFYFHSQTVWIGNRKLANIRFKYSLFFSGKSACSPQIIFPMIGICVTLAILCIGRWKKEGDKNWKNWKKAKLWSYSIDTSTGITIITVNFV